MDNSDVARVFRDIADLLELKGENRFKIRAYQRAARSIDHLSVDLHILMKEGRLREIPGIGEAISEKIVTLLTSGSLDLLEALRAEVPQGVVALMDIPGIGPKTAMRLAKELGISNPGDLEKAIAEGKVAGMAGLGEKTAGNMLRHIQAMRHKDQRVPLGQALPVVEAIIASLRGVPGLHNMVAAGSLRRFKETIGDIDIMGTATEPASVLEEFVRLPQVREVLVRGSTKASVILSDGLQADMRIVESDSFGTLLQYFTGSKEHNVALRERAVRHGLKINEYGITDLQTGVLEKFRTEEACYQRLRLAFIPPELREGTREIDEAERRTLPNLIEVGDVKGDCHAHTNWSDGQDSIEAMALAAKALGWEYLAITDHSSGRGIAHGLAPERLRGQIAEVRRIGQSLPGIRLLAGAEVDIRADGTLDFPDELLAELDIVLAAVHSAMGQDREKITGRVIKAIENPSVHIVAHPTCRLLGQRDPVDIDLEEVFQAAARTNTALEINAMPERLDLKDIHAFRARELGCRLVISTDAHQAGQLALMRFGVGVARRAWCEAKEILNTRPLAELEAFLRRADRSGR